MECLEEYDVPLIRLTGFDHCILGVIDSFEQIPRICYSRTRILETLQKEMSYEDAVDYYEYNILNVHFGEHNPVFLDELDNPNIQNPG